MKIKLNEFISQLFLYLWNDRFVPLWPEVINFTVSQ